MTIAVLKPPKVDFVILKDGIVDELIEVKYSDETISKSLVYYAERLQPRRAAQIVLTLKRPFSKGHLDVLDPLTYFGSGFYQKYSP